MVSQLGAMAVAQVDPRETLQWSLLIGLGISLAVVWRKSRKQRKTKAYSVNCFSRNFRA
jgi:hypothetical protein